MDSLPVLEKEFYGFNQGYDGILQKMQQLHEEVCLQKKPNHLMLLEHEPVITITKQHQEKSLKSSKEKILNDEIKLIEADRGGDATFHGPGQLVGYPIINLSSIGAHNFDAEFYVRTLEKALLKTCIDLGVTNATLLKGFSGIWIKTKKEKSIRLRKLIAIGVGIKNGATKHGFAFNLDIKYEKYLQHIVPCGLADKGVITLKEIFTECGLEMPDYSVIISLVSSNIAKTFGLNLARKL